MIELYNNPTANGQRATIALEEVGERYRVHHIDLMQGEHLTDEFLAMNPVGRVPVIIDREPVEPVTVYGGMAIAFYLAEKHGRFIPADPIARAMIYQWAAMVVSDLNPALAGQFYFSVLAEPPQTETVKVFEQVARRMLKVLDDELASRSYLAGEDYSVADILAYPSVKTSAARLEGAISSYPNLQRWEHEIAQRPAVAAGMAAAS